MIIKGTLGILVMIMFVITKIEIAINMDSFGISGSGHYNILIIEMKMMSHGDDNTVVMMITTVVMAQIGIVVMTMVMIVVIMMIITMVLTVTMMMAKLKVMKISPSHYHPCLFSIQSNGRTSLLDTLSRFICEELHYGYDENKHTSTLNVIVIEIENLHFGL